MRGLHFMHEVSLATALINLVHEQAAAARARRVTRLVLEIGTLSHVDAHALRFAVDVARGGPAEGATLEILEPEGTAYCLDCETRWRSRRAKHRVPAAAASSFLFRAATRCG